MYFIMKKIEGIMILKLAMVKRLYVGQIIGIKGTPRNPKEPKEPKES